MRDAPSTEVSLMPDKIGGRTYVLVKLFGGIEELDQSLPPSNLVSFPTAPSFPPANLLAIKSFMCLSKTHILADHTQRQSNTLLPFARAKRQRDIAFAGRRPCAVEVGRAAASTPVPPTDHKLLHRSLALVARVLKNAPHKQNPFP